MQLAITDNDPEQLASAFHTAQKALTVQMETKERVRFRLVNQNLLLEGLMKMSKVDQAMRTFHMFLEQGLRPNLVTFEILIDGLLNHWNEDEARRVQAIMERDYGIAARVGIHNLWIAFHLKNHQVTTATELLEDMKRDGIRPNAMTFRCFMKYHLSVSDYTAAEQTKTALMAEGLVPDVQFYNSIIRVLARKRAFSEIESLVGEMRSASPQLHPSTYKELIESYATVRDSHKIALLFEEMERFQITPDVALYNALLAMYSDSDAADQARSLLVTMNSRGVKFNAFTYVALLYGLIKQHRFVEASEIISKMDRSGTALPASTNARLIQLCCEKRFHPGIQFTREQMRKNHIKPNLTIYTALIEMNLRCLRYGSVDGLLREMEAEGVQWNVVLYGVLLNHFIEYFDIRRVQLLLERMKRDNVALTASIYDTVMRAFYVYCRYAQGGYLFRVRPVFEEEVTMKTPEGASVQPSEASSIQPSESTSFVRLDSARLDLAQLKTSFERVFAIPFQMSVHIFNDLMLTFLRLARFDEFFECFAEIRKNGLRPNLLTYTLLIKARLYLGQPEAARMLLSEMLKLGLQPTVLQCALIFHVFCRNLATESAEEFLSEVTSQLHLKPNHVFYASLLYAYSRRRDYANVFATFDRLEKAGFVPDTETCNYVLMSLYEIGEYSEASRFFEKMVLQGVRRNTHTYYIMSDRLVFQGDADRFLDKLVDCLTPGNSIDALPFNRLLGNYYRTSQFDIMRRVMDKMIEFVVKFDEGTLPFVTYLFGDHVSTGNWTVAETILKKAVVDFDPSNYQVKAMVDRYRDQLLSDGEKERLIAFDAFLDGVDDTKRMWTLPSPHLPSEETLMETSTLPVRRSELSSLRLEQLLNGDSNG